MLACAGGQVDEVDLTAPLEPAGLVPETGRLDLGLPTSRGNLLAGWSGDEAWGPTSVVWALAPQSSVSVERWSRGPMDLTFRAHAMFDLPVPQRMAIAVNDVVIDSLVIEPSVWRDYRVAIPASALRLGSNRFDFRYATSSAGILRNDPRALTVAWDWIDFDAAAPALRAPPPAANAGELVVPFSHGLEFFLDLTKASALELDGFGTWRTTELAADTELVIRVDAADGSSHERRLRVTEERQASAGVPLSTAGGPSRLVLAASSASAGTAGLTLLRPRVTHAAPLRLPPTPPPTAAARPPNVVLYLVDTLRPDRLGVYGYGRPTSPAVDAFARDAVVYTQAYAQSGWTRSAVASILTGLPPLAHGALNRANGIGTVPFLPEMLRRAGYQTIGLSANPNVSAVFGFGRGFDRYDDVSEPIPAHVDCSVTSHASDQINEEFFRWLDAGPKRPFFAFLHTMYPHDPYRPSAEHRAAFAGDSQSGLCMPVEAEIQAYLRTHPTSSREQVRDELSNLYDGEVADADRQFGMLIDKLRENGSLDDTLIVFVSDHGEEFLEHDQWGHGHTLYRELVHVPLVVRFPGGRPGVVDQYVQQVDIVPTVLAAAGVSVPPSLPGLDLRALANGVDAGPRELVAELQLDAAHVSGLVARDHHYLEWRRPRGGTEVFDWTTDPAEGRPLVDNEFWPSFLRSRLAARQRDQPTAATTDVEISPELANRLRALGYLGGRQ